MSFASFYSLYTMQLIISAFMNYFIWFIQLYLAGIPAAPGKNEQSASFDVLCSKYIQS